MCTILTFRKKKRDCIQSNAADTTVKYGGGSSVLGDCFVAGGPGSQVTINGIMNSTKYQEILAPNLSASARRLRLGRE